MRILGRLSDFLRSSSVGGDNDMSHFSCNPKSSKHYLAKGWVLYVLCLDLRSETHGLLNEL